MRILLKNKKSNSEYLRQFLDCSWGFEGVGLDEIFNICLYLSECDLNRAKEWKA